MNTPKVVHQSVGLPIKLSNGETETPVVTLWDSGEMTVNYEIERHGWTFVVMGYGHGRQVSPQAYIGQVEEKHAQNIWVMTV